MLLERTSETDYRIAGGAPAGISIRPVVFGCRTKRTSIKTITIHGKRSTTLSGIEMEELPFNLIRRRKKDNRGVIRSFSTRVGRFGEEGIRFTRFCTSPMAAVFPRPCFSRDVKRSSASRPSVDVSGPRALKRLASS